MGKRETTGLAGSIIGTAKRIVGWDGVRSTWDWMAEGARILDPRPHMGKTRLRSRNPLSFESAMARAGIDEREVARRHVLISVSALIALTGCLVSLGVLLHSLHGLRLGGALGAAGSVIALGSVFLAYSFRAWKLRVRDLDAGLDQFLAKPGSWLPPVFYIRQDGK